jgi:hypothetical protein
MRAIRRRSAIRSGSPAAQRSASGKVLESVKLAAFPVLPKRQQRFLLPLKSDLSPGPYTLRARIDVGKEIQEASSVVRAETPVLAVKAPEVAVK